MKLFVIRHAIAVEAEQAETDSQRALSEKGRNKMIEAARGLRRIEEQLDLILTSPYLRAVQTAEILRQTYKLERSKLVKTKHLSPTGFADQLIEEIRKKHNHAETIALVGHEPYLSALVSMLVSGSADMAMTFKKGGVCRLTVEAGALQHGRCATLDWALFPSHLVEIGNRP